MKAVLALSLTCVMALAAAAQAQHVTAKISTREAYVGLPLVLQVQITNAENYQLPDIPEIDGCHVTATGTPSRSSRFTITNGHRTASRSITVQYLVTPRRAGTFEIPSLGVEVDGKIQKTAPIRFVATRSETGDLLFVEIEGDQDEVYVGEPLDLKLKIWIKPFKDREKEIVVGESNGQLKDRENRIVFSEGNMWQLVSKNSSWGSFAENLQEMAGNNQRPRGQEVLRADSQGIERSYYLYEIDATVYPKRPGKIDASDVQIVVNYPTALGRSRDPFSSFFGGSSFGASDLLKQMMDDDRFASPLARRLTVSESRPIVAEAKTDSTRVLPVPTAGRPADYRGAVGRYRIVTEAEPLTVDAGDPITLRIGIVGDGPMDLVEAPPLADIEAVTSDFKVTDQSLAGFVHDKTKMFVTTLRPRREGISEIPPIPLSYFDPATASFKTVTSNPIPITVHAAETLSMDGIVTNIKAGSGTTSGDATSGGLLGAGRAKKVSLQNSFSGDLLLHESSSAGGNSWWWLLLAPPVIWGALVIDRLRRWLASHLASMLSARRVCLAAVEAAGDQAGLVKALVRYIGARSRKVCNSPSQAVGLLRTAGLGSESNEVELFFESLQRRGVGDRLSESDPLAEQKSTCCRLVDQLETSFVAIDSQRLRSSYKKTRSHGRKLRRAGSQLAAMFLLLLAVPAMVLASEPAGQPAGRAAGAPALNQAQQQVIFDEANQSYQQAEKLSATDQAEAKSLFFSSAKKYQLLVNAGLPNSRLYQNLANACLQSGQLGRAIANYHHALRIDPANQQAAANLRFAQAKVAATGPSPAADERPGSTLSWMQSVSQVLMVWPGSAAVRALLVTASGLFWGVLIFKLLGWQFTAWKFALVPGVLVVICGLSLMLAGAPSDQATGILVTSEVALHEGDGSEFPTRLNLTGAQGQQVTILARRGTWVEIQTDAGTTGWVPGKALEQI
jgi:hypothetical protein